MKELNSLDDTNSIINGLEKLYEDNDYLKQKGKGYSFFGISNNHQENLINYIKRKYNHGIYFYRLSEISSNSILNSSTDMPVLIHQDLSLNELLVKIDILVNRIIYPAWFKGVPIVFVSNEPLSSYKVGDIKGFLVHSDYKGVLEYLALEQMLSLLDLVNTNIVSEEMLIGFDVDVKYTPIEQIFKDELVKRNISFEPQVKLGRFYVDFLIELDGRKIIVECDGRDYHDAEKDKKRDKELAVEGYEIYRFTGSRIFNDCESCISEIKNDLKKKTLPEIELEELNKEQETAVHYLHGPIRVLAPAGSGKTKTLVNRIANLVNSGVDEEEILALAFNKKASVEMEERLSKTFGINNVNVKTFHSFGNQVVRDILKWQYNRENEETVTRKLLEKSVTKHEKIAYKRNRDNLDEYMDMLSRSKNELLAYEDMIVEVDAKEVDFKPILNDYLKEMKDHQFYNFDDMLYLANRLLLQYSEYRSKTQNRYKYILVDEFQDLNKSQLLLLQILVAPENNVFVCGDDDQMIYSFRGAEVKHILEFNKRYAINFDQTLRINYRSASDIVKHSKWLIDHNETRVYKDIIAYSDVKGEVQLFAGNSLLEQGEEIAKWIKSLKNDNTRWSDFAVVYRYNQYNDILFMILNKYDIPAQFRGRHILTHRVGRTLMSYFRIIYNHELATQEDYEEVLKRPNKYLTNEFINNIKTWEDFIDIDKAAESLREMDIKKYKNFVRKFRIYDVKDKNPGQVFDYIKYNFEIEDYYKDQSKLSDEVDMASDIDILEIIINFSRLFKTNDDFYDKWLELEDKATENSEEHENEGPKEDRVNLTSIHRTKGNEYKNVAYFNLVKGNFNYTQDVKTEEERRIAYVGVTRAKDALFVTTLKGELSPFIKETFLNPKFKELADYELSLEIDNLKKDIADLSYYIENTIYNSQQKLRVDYPELTGQNVSIGGLFSGYKKSIRENQVQKASKKYNEYNNKKLEVLGVIEGIALKKDKLKEELKYRAIINNALERDVVEETLDKEPVIEEEFFEEDLIKEPIREETTIESLIHQEAPAENYEDLRSVYRKYLD